MKVNKLMNALLVFLILIICVGAVFAEEDVSAGDSVSSDSLGYLSVSQGSVVDGGSVSHSSNLKSVDSQGNNGYQGKSDVNGVKASQYSNGNSQEYIAANEISNNNGLKIDSNALGSNVVKEGVVGTFTDLHELIKNSTTKGITEINLTQDYRYNPDVDKDFPYVEMRDTQGDGNYKYGITFTDIYRDVILNGNGHFVDGDHQARIFNLTYYNHKLHLKNLKLINGYVESSTPTVGGAAIYYFRHDDRVTQLNITNCTFENNMAYNTDVGEEIGHIGTAIGGAIYYSKGLNNYDVLRINDCTFRNNTANYGGAIYATSYDGTAMLAINNSTFEDNHANSMRYNNTNGEYFFENAYYSHGWGGAIYTYGATINNTKFIGNQGGNHSGFGGAVSAYDADFINCTFEDNFCYQGGAIGDGHMTRGVEVDIPSYFTFDNCTFNNNTAQLAAGAILTRNIGGHFHVNYPDILIKDSSFDGNDGGVYGGGAIMASCVNVTNTNFTNNKVHDYGGAISAGAVHLTDVILENNTAQHGAAVFAIGYVTENVTYKNNVVKDDTGDLDAKVLVFDDCYTEIDVDYSELPSYHNYSYEDFGDYGFVHRLGEFGQVVEYDFKDVKGNPSGVAGTEGIITPDMSYVVNYLDGREMYDYIKILYYLSNLDENFRDGSFRTYFGDYSLQFLIRELCYSDLNNPINEFVKNVTALYDAGLRIPDGSYILKDVLKEHMALTDVMVPYNAEKILAEEYPAPIIYEHHLFIIPMYNTNYLFYHQYNMTVKKEPLTKSVLKGEDVEFKITLSNNCDYDFNNVFLIDNDFADGLVYKGYKNGTGKWTYDDNTGKWLLASNGGVLGAHNSVDIIVIFTAIGSGNLTNNVTGGFNNTTVNNTTSVEVFNPDLDVQKITLTPLVFLGQQTMFKILVTNVGDCNLTSVFVTEDLFEDLVLDSFRSEDNWYGNLEKKRFYYKGILTPGESTSFIVIFNTTKTGNFTNYVTAGSNETDNKTANNTTEVINPKLSIVKISKNDFVQVGDEISFIIRVENIGDTDLTGVYVSDNEYSEGLVFMGYLDPLDKWTFDGNDKWSYNDVLKVGESAEFEVFFKTLTWGYKVNTAVAGNNITNETVNSTNHTCVGNCTPCNNETKNDTNKTPDQPDKPDQPVPHKPVVPKRNMLLPTGNPLFALVLVLIIVGLSPIRRKK